MTDSAPKDSPANNSPQADNSPQANDSPQDSLIEIAAVTGPHGVRGQLKLKVFLEDPMDLLSFGQPLWAKGSPAPAITIEGESKGLLIVRFANVRNRGQAEALKGKTLKLPSNALPELDDEDEFYVTDLIGLSLITEDGAPFGTINLVEDYGAGDVVEISERPDKKPIHLPFTKAIFPKVDLAAGQVTIVPPGEVVSQDEDGAVH